jgi:ribosomal protein L37E
MEEGNPTSALGATSTWVHICERCGEQMEERQCKIVCRNCGMTRDCSDP